MNFAAERFRCGDGGQFPVLIKLQKCKYRFIYQHFYLFIFFLFASFSCSERWIFTQFEIMGTIIIIIMIRFVPFLLKTSFESYFSLVHSFLCSTFLVETINCTREVDNNKTTAAHVSFQPWLNTFEIDLNLTFARPN